MHRLSALVLAIVAAAAILALGAAGAAADTVVKKKTFGTIVIAAFTPASGETYSAGTFAGKLTSTKNKCLKGRTVVVQRPNGSNVGQGQSNGSGDWSVAGSSLTQGQYTVTAEKTKTIKEKDKPDGTHVKKKVICAAATVTVAVG